VPSHGAELIASRGCLSFWKTIEQPHRKPISRVSESLHVPKDTIAQGCRLSCRNSFASMKTSINELSSKPRGGSLNVWYQRIS